MNMLKKQLKMLLVELNKQGISKERVLEIKEITKQLAGKIDDLLAVNVAVGMVNELYKTETAYPKRRVKRVVNLLLGYLL